MTIEKNSVTIVDFIVDLDEYFSSEVQINGNQK
jgi:hypothetical protein